MPLADNRTPSISALQPRLKRKLGKRDQPPADTDTLLHELRDELLRSLAGVLSVGGSVQLGSTRDRTAMLVRAWIAGDVYEDYCTSVAELAATLEALDDVVQGSEARDPRPLTKRA
jgi:hypothetical protein